MSDKKKKKSKQKQKQKQQQTQQVIVNVGSSVRRRQEPRSQVRENKLNMSAQPPPIVQYVYRDNLALNSINDKMRENAITQTLLKTAQQLASQSQSQQAPKLATPSAALYQQQPIITTPAPRVSRDSSIEQLMKPSTPQPVSSFNFVKELLDNNKIHTSPALPTTETKEQKLKMTDFYKVLSPTPPPNPFEKAKETNITTTQNPPPNNPFKLTKHGLPDKRLKNYNEIMENYIGAIPREERSKKQQKAYEEYLNTLTKPSGDNSSEPINEIIDERTRLLPPTKEDL